MPEFSVRNLVSNRTKEGLVELVLDGKPLAQLTVSEAREISQNINECAAVAECEAHLLAFLMDRIKLTTEQAAQILADFRQRRGL